MDRHHVRDTGRGVRAPPLPAMFRRVSLASPLGPLTSLPSCRCTTLPQDPLLYVYLSTESDPLEPHDWIDTTLEVRMPTPPILLRYRVCGVVQRAAGPRRPSAANDCVPLSISFSTLSRDDRA